MTHSQLQFRLFVGKVLTNVPDDHSLFRDEVFGPVTAITKFSTESEVIKRANDTNYGLCATVWTKDLTKANRVARKIRAGTSFIRSIHLFTLLRYCVG